MAFALRKAMKIKNIELVYYISNNVRTNLTLRQRKK